MVNHAAVSQTLELQGFFLAKRCQNVVKKKFEETLVFVEGLLQQSTVAMRLPMRKAMYRMFKL